MYPFVLEYNNKYFLHHFILTNNESYFKNHSQRIDLDTTPPDNSLGLQPTSIHLKDVFADAWKIFIKTALPTLGLLVLISFLTAVFRLIYIPADWYIHNINPEYTAIIEKYPIVVL